MVPPRRIVEVGLVATSHEDWARRHHLLPARSTGLISERYPISEAISVLIWTHFYLLFIKI